VAPSLGVELTAVNAQDAGEIERAVTEFARAPNSGLIVTGGAPIVSHRERIVVERWNDVPRGTMDEVSSHVRLDLPISQRQGRLKDCSTSSSNPRMEDAMGRRRGYCIHRSL
jgi:hypothetical protein